MPVKSIRFQSERPLKLLGPSQINRSQSHVPGFFLHVVRPVDPIDSCNTSKYQQFAPVEIRWGEGRVGIGLDLWWYSWKVKSKITYMSWSCNRIHHIVSYIFRLQCLDSWVYSFCLVFVASQTNDGQFCVGYEAWGDMGYSDGCACLV